jgi:hypothetical protein
MHMYYSYCLTITIIVTAGRREQTERNLNYWTGMKMMFVLSFVRRALAKRKHCGRLWLVTWELPHISNIKDISSAHSRHRLSSPWHCWLLNIHHQSSAVKRGKLQFQLLLAKKQESKRTRYGQYSHDSGAQLSSSHVLSSSARHQQRAIDRASKSHLQLHMQPCHCCAIQQHKG